MQSILGDAAQQSCYEPHMEMDGSFTSKAPIETWIQKAQLNRFKFPYTGQLVVSVIMSLQHACTAKFAVGPLPGPYLCRILINRSPGVSRATPPDHCQPAS